MDEGLACPVAAPNAPDAAPGEIRFVDDEQRHVVRTRLATAGMLVVELEVTGTSIGSGLAAAVDEAIERALCARGSAGAGASSVAFGDRDSILGDQLFRARRAGANGIGVMLGSLGAAVGRLGALQPEDCATLRFLARATRERPLALILHAGDRVTGAYGAPVTLGELLLGDAGEDSVALPASRLASAAVEPNHAPPPAIETGDTWRTWTLALGAARGPQPLSVLERLFAEAYMPLAQAVDGGVDDPRARRARDEFRDTFAKGYVDAFPTFAVTTKRPRMVYEAHDIAARIARLHGARSTRLLLVDGMRWDVSQRIADRLVAKLGSRASLTEQLVLWSALPSTTIRQLEMIARGTEALRTPATLETEAEPPRGRTAEYIRRMRVGPREIHKLDIVESRLRQAQGEVLREMRDVPEAAAEAIARHCDSLAPRTLLFVFGDHGFVVDRAGFAHQGGASPEEVLVGAFALLVGDVH